MISDVIAFLINIRESSFLITLRRPPPYPPYEERLLNPPLLPFPELYDEPLRGLPYELLRELLLYIIIKNICDSAFVALLTYMRFSEEGKKIQKSKIFKRIFILTY